MRFCRFMLLSISMLMIGSCQFSPDKNKDPGKSKDGTSIIKSYYEKSKALKTEITVKDNKKHGPAKKYYPTGELHTLVYYNNGIKEGETFWYHKNGQAYRVTPYKDGKMHGIRKKYYKDGQLQAEIPYENGEVIEGTKEYKQNGDLINQDTQITYKTSDNLKFENKFSLLLKLSEKHADIEFFREKTSVDGEKVLIPVKVNLSGTGKINFTVLKGKSKNIILTIYAKYKTRLGNPVLIKDTYHLDIANN